MLFLIIGQVVDQNYYADLQVEIVKRKLEDRIKFTGYLENVQLYMKEFSFILHTAINEPFGRVLIENALEGRPSIAYDSGGIKEIILHKETGYLVKVGEVLAMADFALKLLKHPGKYNHCCESSEMDVRERFHVSLYSELLGQILNA
ncbi:MAG: glycosyltransferase [Tannerellaceae bacterium]|nr:glycosyltransferase [Tannerellaceae bacterium]